MYFYSFIIEYFCFSWLQFRIEEKIHTKAVVDVSRGVGRRFFCFSGRGWKGVRRKLLPLIYWIWIWIWNLYQNLIIALLKVAVCSVLFQKLYTILRKKEPARQEICNFFLQNGVFQILKMFKNNMKFTRKACWINSKISHRNRNTTHDILTLSLLLVIIMVELLNVLNALELYFLKLLEVNCSNTAFPYNPFLKNNRNMTGNSVGKKCFPVMNVKLQVKLRFKTFY